LLVKAGFISRRDLVKALLIFILPRQHDLHELARLAHDPVAIRIAPLTPCINDRQSSRKAWRDFAVDEARPGGIAHPHSVADLAAEHQLRHLLWLSTAAFGRLCVRVPDNGEPKEYRRVRVTPIHR
jgi:hypothetical protein